MSRETDQTIRKVEHDWGQKEQIGRLQQNQMIQQPSMITVNSDGENINFETVKQSLGENIQHPPIIIPQTQNNQVSIEQNDYSHNLESMNMEILRDQDINSAQRPDELLNLDQLKSRQNSAEKEDKKTNDEPSQRLQQNQIMPLRINTPQSNVEINVHDQVEINTVSQKLSKFTVKDKNIEKLNYRDSIFRDVKVQKKQVVDKCPNKRNSFRILKDYSQSLQRRQGHSAFVGHKSAKTSTMELRNHLNIHAPQQPSLPPSSRIHLSLVNQRHTGAEGRRNTINVQNNYAPQNLIAKEINNREKQIIDQMKKEMRSQIQSVQHLDRKENIYQGFRSSNRNNRQINLVSLDLAANQYLQTNPDPDTSSLYNVQNPSPLIQISQLRPNLQARSENANSQRQELNSVQNNNHFQLNDFDQIRENGQQFVSNLNIPISEGQRHGIPELQSENMAIAQRDRADYEARLSSMGGDFDVDPEVFVTVRRHKKDYCTSGIFQSALMLIFLSQLNMQWQANIQLYNHHFECFCFIWVNMLLYLFSIVLDIICFQKLNPYNYRQLRVFNHTANALIVFIAFWGIRNIASTKMIKLVEKEPKVYAYLYQVVIWMVWIRLLIVLVILFACLIFSALFLIMAVQNTGRRDSSNRILSQRNIRLPGVRKFLEQRARVFNPSKNGVDKLVEQCVICLEEFKEGDGKKIAELNCNRNHIFHLNCLNEWIEKNDICPMCREPIIKDQVDKNIQNLPNQQQE